MLKLKSLINEAPTDDLSRIFDPNSDIERSHGNLTKAIKDPKVQAVLMNGLADGDIQDDKFPYERTYIGVRDLLPTQQEIAFDKSVIGILTNEWKSLESILQGKPKMGRPIVTYDGKYIIDGHHRWSTAFAANPNAKMLALNIKGRPGYKATDILKAVHGAVAAKLGKVPSASAKDSINVLQGVTEAQVQAAVKANLSDAAFDLWKQYSPVTADTQKVDITSPEDVATVITANLQLMRNNGPAPGAPKRDYMPQTDAGEQDPIDHLGNLSKGVINVAPPYQQESVQQKFKRIARI